MSALATLPIAVLAEQAGVDVETIRLYGHQGLLSKPRRTLGLVLYAPDDVSRVVFIKRAFDLGFPVEAVREMLGVGRKASLGCSGIYAIAQRHLADIRRRQAELARMEKALAPLVETCPRKGGLANCNIVQALSHPPISRQNEPHLLPLAESANGRSDHDAALLSPLEASTARPQT
jgi:MerR family mercuric resistance operon transcriptional regulator